MSSTRVTEQRSFGPTLGWEALPTLGQATPRRRFGRVLRWTIVVAIGAVLALGWLTP